MTRLLMATVLFCLLSCRAAVADRWGPWTTPSDSEEQTTPTAHQAGQAPNSDAPLQLAIRIFQRYISPVDGARCPMYPTCSTYARQALAKHGTLMGVFLTVDRLYRETDPHEQQQPIVKWGYIRYYDPLESNDFWLKGKEQR